MKETYNNLYLFVQDKSKGTIGCGYYYIVTNGASSHTAFRTKAALKTWLKITGLTIGKRSGRSVKLTGTYHRITVMQNMSEFYANYGTYYPFYALCNGSYSIGFYKYSDAGNELYIQNPNTDRPICDYFKVTEHLETGKPVRNIYR